MPRASATRSSSARSPCSPALPAWSRSRATRRRAARKARRHGDKPNRRSSRWAGARSSRSKRLSSSPPGRSPRRATEEKWRAIRRLKHPTVQSRRIAPAAPETPLTDSWGGPVDLPHFVPSQGLPTT
uniref:Uncharacterized protein n=1 Tax=Mus musculus TaxID=10090 RepID=Q8C218_MOUSE|nr:unnamed protein product [Mus musculus]